MIITTFFFLIVNGSVNKHNNSCPHLFTKGLKHVGVLLRTSNGGFRPAVIRSQLYFWSTCLQKEPIKAMHYLRRIIKNHFSWMTPKMSWACRRCVWWSVTFSLLCLQEKSGMTYRDDQAPSRPPSAFYRVNPQCVQIRSKAERCAFYAASCVRSSRGWNEHLPGCCGGSARGWGIRREEEEEEEESDAGGKAEDEEEARVVVRKQRGKKERKRGEARRGAQHCSDTEAARPGRRQASTSVLESEDFIGSRGATSSGGNTTTLFVKIERWWQSCVSSL